MSLGWEVLRLSILICMISRGEIYLRCESDVELSSTFRDGKVVSSAILPVHTWRDFNSASKPDRVGSTVVVHQNRVSSKCIPLVDKINTVLLPSVSSEQINYK